MDIVLSSGFLAFARHVGVLDALTERGVRPTALCGTSSGALVGALWVSGWTPDAVFEEVTAQQPVQLLGWSWRPWVGLFTLEPVLGRLRQHLPARFEDLEIPLSVGVMTPDGGHALLSAGSLPEAVAASCAVPWLFQPIQVDGHWFADGGAVDRTGFATWAEQRATGPTVVHIVERSAGAAQEPSYGEATVIRTPRSGAKLWSLGDARAQRAEARELALRALDRV